MKLALASILIGSAAAFSMNMKAGKNWKVVVKGSGHMTAHNMRFVVALFLLGTMTTYRLSKP